MRLRSASGWSGRTSTSTDPAKAGSLVGSIDLMRSHAGDRLRLILHKCDIGPEGAKARFPGLLTQVQSAALRMETAPDSLCRPWCCLQHWNALSLISRPNPRGFRVYAHVHVSCRDPVTRSFGGIFKCTQQQGLRPQSPACKLPTGLLIRTCSG